MKRFTALLVGLFSLSQLQAQTLLNTGTPAQQTRLALGGGYYCTQSELPPEFCQNWNAVGLQFSQPTVVSGVEAFLSSVNQGVSYSPTEGLVDLVLYDGGWSELRRTQFFVPAQQIGWKGVTGLNWQLTPGKYWFAVEVPLTSKFVGGWFIDAPLPAQFAATYKSSLGVYQESTPTTLAAIISGYSQPTSDLNRDGSVDILDMDVLVEGLRVNSIDLLYDVDGDFNVSKTDWDKLVQDARLIAGDANLDGLFDSSDMVLLFQSGQYEDSIVRNASWRTGDFTGDLEFDSNDLIVAFAQTGYETTQLPALAVPEPSACCLLLLGISLIRTRK